MADLYEFPYFSRGKQLAKQVEQLAGKAQFITALPRACHSFTRFRAFLYPTLWKVEKTIEIPQHQWLSLEELERLPFSSGHRRVLKEVCENFAHGKL